MSNASVLHRSSLYRTYFSYYESKILFLAVPKIYYKTLKTLYNNITKIMEIFLLEVELQLTDWLKNLLYVSYCISLLFLSITILLYMLNLKQFGMPNKRPRKKSGAILTIIYMSFVLLWQLLVIVYVSKERKSRILLGFAIFLAVIFHVFRIAFLLRMLYGILYWQKTFGIEGLKKYFIVVIISLAIMIVIIVESRLKKETSLQTICLFNLRLDGY